MALIENEVAEQDEFVAFDEEMKARIERNPSVKLLTRIFRNANSTLTRIERLLL
jgi:hypothetical protein